MFDPWSTLFSAVQRESRRGVIGRQAYDHRAYEVLHGNLAEQPVPRRRGVHVAAALVGLGAVGVGLHWLAQLFA